MRNTNQCVADLASSLGWFITTGLVLVALLLLALKWWMERRKHVYTTSWFRPHEYAGTLDPTWDDVVKIAQSDPLSDEHKGNPRCVEFSILAKDVAIILFALALLLGVALSLMTGSGFSVIAGMSNEKVTVIGALFGVVITLYIAMRQLMAKVRSDNRQKWIDEVRKHLSRVLYYIPSYEAEDETVYVCKVKAERSRLALELLMNPAEKDHRVLGYLLRKALRLDTHKVDDAINREVKLKFLCDLDPEDYKDHDEIVGYIIRLSNAILKREWERVKYGS